MVITKQRSGRQYHFAVYRGLGAVKPFNSLQDALAYAATFNEDLTISQNALPHFAEYVRGHDEAADDMVADYVDRCEQQAEDAAREAANGTDWY